MSNNKEYTIWSEGYADNGMSQGAICLGTYMAISFEDAINKYLERNPDMKEYYYIDSKGNHKIWGCRLYDNAEDAEKSFG